MSEAGKERKGCRARILRMLKRKNLTLEELEKEHQQKHIHLFKGHVKQMNMMLVEEKDKKALTEDDQRPPSAYRRIIRRTIHSEGCSLKEFGERKLHKDVRVELDRMIQNEKEQNKKQDEKKMISTSTKPPLVIACRLNIDNLVHFVNVGLNIHKEPLSLSNRTLCGQSVTRDDISQFSNEATCLVCLRKQKSK